VFAFLKNDFLTDLNRVSAFWSSLLRLASKKFWPTPCYFWSLLAHCHEIKNLRRWSR